MTLTYALSRYSPLSWDVPIIFIVLSIAAVLFLIEEMLEATLFVRLVRSTPSCPPLLAIVP